MVRQTAARVAREVYGPHALEWDQNRTEFPIEERRRLGSLGMLGISLPEEYGGSGRRFSMRWSRSRSWPRSAGPRGSRSSSPTPARRRWSAQLGSDHLKQKYLPGIVCR